jgi:hypothetical protein
VSGPAVYVETIGVEPGEMVRFHVSAPAAFSLDVVRLGRRAILDPDSDVSADRAEAEVLATFDHATATPRSIEPGSYLFIEGDPVPSGPATLGLWVRPWRLPVLDQTQWAWASLLTDLEYPMAARFALLIDHLGRIGVHIGDGGAFDHADLRYSEAILGGRLGRWLHVAVAIGPGGVELFVDGHLEPLYGGAGAAIDALPPPRPSSRLRIGASAEQGRADDFLDGDIAAPFVAASALGPREIRRIALDQGRTPFTKLGLGPLHGAWDLDEEKGDRVADASGNGRVGRIVQGGTWQIGGPAFDAGKGGATDSPLADPSRGHGLRLSSDDLIDCGWPVSAEWSVPQDAATGLYAGLLRLAGQQVDTALPVTFAVTRRQPRRQQSVALLLATNTWYAYGRRPADVAAAYGLSASFYSTHASGRPHFWLTTQAPIPRATPFGFESARAELVGHSHLVRPERYAEAWLEREGFAYEVITDADLHAEPSLLGAFGTLLIAGHSEYWSDEARDGVEAFLDAGGGVLSLSGDSMHWRVSVDTEGTLIECRKEVAEPDPRWLEPAWWGERWHMHDARPGGSYRLIGRPAHQTIGLDAQGMIDDGTPTGFRPLRVLEPDHLLFKFPERVPISPAGTIGERCLNGPKVSGYEFDAVPEAVGTRRDPLPGTTLLAVADQPNLEWQGRFHDRGADLIDWVRPAGGRVISLGSIGATGSLGVDAGVSALARNALAALGAARRE